MTLCNCRLINKAHILPDMSVFAIFKDNIIQGVIAYTPIHYVVPPMNGVQNMTSSSIHLAILSDIFVTDKTQNYETQLIEHVQQYAKESGVTILLSSFLPSENNVPLPNWLQDVSHFTKYYQQRLSLLSVWVNVLDVNSPEYACFYALFQQNRQMNLFNDIDWYFVVLLKHNNKRSIHYIKISSGYFSEI